MMSGSARQRILLRVVGGVMLLIGSLGVAYAIVELSHGHVPGGLSLLLAATVSLLVGVLCAFGGPAPTREDSSGKQR